MTYDAKLGQMAAILHLCKLSEKNTTSACVLILNALYDNYLLSCHGFYFILNSISVTSGLNTALGGDPDAVVKAGCLESRRSRVRTPLGPSSFKDSILWGASVTEK